MLAILAAAVSFAPKPFFDQPFLLGAHRGGGMRLPESTELIFRDTARRYPNMLLETDVRVTRDGQLVLLHDETVDQTTNGKGKMADLTLAEARKLDAGYRFTLDGKTFPYRGKGVRVATLEEALRAAPHNRFEIDLKSAEVAEKVAEVVTRMGAEDRVMLASFVPAAMAKARQLMPKAVLCYDFNNGAKLLMALRGRGWENYQPEADVLSMMTEQVAQYKITPEEINKIRAKGIRFQIHTLNEPAEIRHWLRIGVDSILTDDPVALVDAVMRPMARAHAHNDYEHPHPLLDAMQEGFASVEADIYLQDGELRVAHDKKDTIKGRTLERLYLDPLFAEFRRLQPLFGKGTNVYPWPGHTQLLVDIKADGAAVYAELKKRLRKYAPMLTRFDGKAVQPGAVTIVLSGDRPVAELARDKDRFLFLDGRASDPTEFQMPEIAPLTSDSFTPDFMWSGRDPMPPAMRERFAKRVQAAHARGQKIRFWGVPDNATAWEEMILADVDYVNTDHLPELAGFLRKRLSRD